MRRLRRIKIIATLGPKTLNPASLRQLIEAGVDVFRLNMSHGGRDAIRDRVAMIRAIERDLDRPIGILADLQGPKLRVASFAGGKVELAKGATFTLDSNPAPGDAKRVHLPHPEILSSLEPGHRVLLDDGKLAMTVVKATPKKTTLRVDIGGALSDRKGVSLPDTIIPVSAMTEKDRGDLDAALEAGVDWIAVSFVQRPDDLAEVRKVARGRALVMAKIEKPQAIARLDEIMEASDALMVARGDLGVEMPMEKVPGLQKRITREARRLGKPVVIATQMLESMITSPVPTRAETSDVATAVFEGADAVMLSAESAVGQYPIEAVAMMNRIANEVESDPLFRAIIDNQRADHESTGSDAIAAAARAIADTLDLKAIIALTASGSTGLRVARERSQSPVIALTPSIDTARRLALAWGVHAVTTEDFTDQEEMVTRACAIATHEGFASPGDRIMIVAGVPFGSQGATNMVRIAFIPKH
ncbi:MAG: pyruvate kinase [Rhizobiales bacterium 65-9]|nr:pyruvate kinase [Hyphomicrobiales bacterium]OJY38023.1 MAG: pyruvate kinase [Rhizobiales bacterium 65-9]